MIQKLLSKLYSDQFPKTELNNKLQLRDHLCNRTRWM